MLKLDATVKMASYLWKTGKELVNVEVTLGSAEKSSSCRVTLADMNHIIAEALINHSLKTGGIEALQAPGVTPVTTTGISPTTSNNSVSQVVPSSVTSARVSQGVKGVNGGAGTKTSMASTGGIFTNEVKAFLDSVVKRESNGATTDIAMSYRSVNLGTGFFPASELNKSRSQINGYNNYIGRYQMGKLGEVEAKARFNISSMTFTPMEQDLMAYNKLIYRNALKPLQAGDIRTAFLRVANEWVSIPGGTANQQVQAGTTMQEYLDYYQQRLKYYQTEAGSISVTPNSSKTVASAKTPTSPAKTDTLTPVIKGTVMTVTINGYSFDFYHQSTEMSDDGTTVLTGQGLRWLMSRRQRSRTVKDTTLKQLATSIAKAHKVPLRYEATFDPSYDHLDQSGISDYALLHREAYLNGLLVTEDKDGILIKELSQLGTPTYTLERGINLISYTMTDQALSGNAEDISAKLLTLQKVAIDPITGILVNSIQDVDRQSSSNTSTGKTKAPVKGTLKTKDTITAKALSGKTKRVTGLPSTFVVPMSTYTLSSSPLTTMITKGFPGCLDRIWVVRSVSHNVSEGTSTLQLNSPVEVKDTEVTVSPNTLATVPLAGSINERIFRAANAARGKNSATDEAGAENGTGNGRYACAWAVNVLVLAKAGVRQLGSNKALVDSARQALESGRGVKVKVTDAVPGDILIMGEGAGGGAHIGIYMGNGLTLSNSSSKATFSWEASYAEYLARPAYRGKLQYYRVLN